MVHNSISVVDLTESRAGPFLAQILLCTAIAAITVALRIYTRFFLIKKRFADDYCIILGLVASVGMAICMGVSVMNGFGLHTAAISPNQLVEQLKVGIGGVVFFHVAHMFIKTSILLQYIHICILSIEKRACYATLAFVIGTGITWIVVVFFNCTPFAAQWNLNTPGAYCINRTAAFYAVSFTTIFSDILILVIPIFLLRHSTLRWYKKLVISVVLGFGGLGCVVGILRVRAILSATTSADSSWDKAPNASLGAVEVNLGIICSSVVTLGPMVRQYLPSAWRSRLSKANRVELGIATLTTDSPDSGSTAEGTHFDLEAAGNGMAQGDKMSSSETQGSKVRSDAESTSRDAGACT